MNRIFLAIACLGALAVIVFAAMSDGNKETAVTKAELTKFAPVSFDAGSDRGSMTTEVSVDLTTGETEETRVIAFVD